MQDGLLELRDLFGAERSFQVPDYQRAYAWGPTQLDEFLADLSGPMQGRPYFMGTFLFAEAGEVDGCRRFHVVDGQQRLTTIVLFALAVIRRLAGTDEERGAKLRRRYIQDGNVPKIRTISTDDAYFQDYVLRRPECAGVSPETPSQQRLLDAQRYLEKALEGHSVDDLLAPMERLERTRALTYVVHDAAEAALIFETTNDRGKRLTDLESIKSFLMFQVNLATAQPQVVLDGIRDHFGAIYRTSERMEVEPEQVFDEDQVLRQHFIAFERWTDEEPEAVKRSMKAEAQAHLRKGPANATAHAQRVARELRESFEQAERVLYGSDTVAGMEGLLAQRRLGSIMPLLIKARKLDSTADKRWFAAISSLLEALIFRTHAVARRRSDAGEAKLARRARDFSGDFPWLVTQVNDALRGWCSDADVERSLRSPRVLEDWSKRDLYYFFWCYENSLRGQHWRLPRTVAFASEARVAPTIEHVWPQTPDVNEWQVGEPMPEEHQETHLHALGNLTIAPRSLNSAMRNLPYDAKAIGYFRRAPLACQNELDDFLVQGRWTPESIERRTEHLIAFAKSRWNPETVRLPDT